MMAWPQIADVFPGAEEYRQAGRRDKTTTAAVAHGNTNKRTNKRKENK